MKNFQSTLIGSFFALAIMLGQLVPARADNPTLKIAVLKFGTVNWVMNVIHHNGLDQKNGFKLEVQGLASKNATTVAFLAGDADAFVTDWFWVLRERQRGSDVVQVPYSASLGAVMVAADSPIKSLDQLEGMTIGVAGGPIDKSWLLLRAHQLSRGQSDLAESATPVFAAPPLLNQQLISGRADAVLNFWHFSARLEGAGYRRLANVSGLMTSLGMPVATPLIGFVFPRKLQTSRPGAISGFVNALEEASRILSTSDAEWERIRPLMKTKSDAEFSVLKERYREGILSAWTAEHKKAAEKLFGILRKIGGDRLTGKGTKFDTAMFWAGQ